MNKMTKSLLSLVFLFSMMLGFAVVANAQTLDLWGGQQTAVASQLGLGTRDIRVTIASIINVALGLLGIVAVGIVLIGGFKWMMAGGDEKKTEEGKNWIKSGVIGLAIILSAYAIANFVIQSLMTATTQK